MEIKEKDIVNVKSLDKEALIMYVAFDLVLKEKRFVVIAEKTNDLYVTDESNLEFICTLEDRLRDYEDENSWSYIMDA